METKPFYLTSEFWGSVGLVLAAVAGLIPGGHKITAAVIAVSTAAYALSRGLAKSGSSPTTLAAISPDEGDAGVV